MHQLTLLASGGGKYDRVAVAKVEDASTSKEVNKGVAVNVAKRCTLPRLECYRKSAGVRDSLALSFFLLKQHLPGSSTRNRTVYFGGGAELQIAKQCLGTALLAKPVYDARP